ncbi:hypothetical protein HGP16_13910 [Rhizobium sp. P40RR-XXII]|uniref:hypothetical protein n=1 Tax=Rhizobium sp. P40RR-XXII TaxID=2726739 RepID=UPI0014564D1A|nr:hypothetical protein [Rhizobium sp. P40RR-XXII]NLS17652.1 hypothetical protein [Rhizobium sp. P40RR-XXII]
MDRQPQAGRRMMIFVATIFVLACVIAVYFTFELYPGEPALPDGTTQSSQTQ